MRVGGFRERLVDVGVLLWLSLLLAAPATIRAERLPFRHYHVADGLAHSSVHCIYQDAKGYLWFGTNEGVSRFDGYRFINYSTRDGLGHPYINAITEDRQGRLWVGTNGGGVSRLLDDPQESGIRGPGSGVRDQHQPTTDNRQRTRPRFVSFLIDDLPTANAVNRMLFDANDTLWCATDAALYRTALDQNGHPTFEVVVPQKSFSSAAAFADRQGRLWFGLEYDLIEIVGNNVITYGADDEVGRHLITSIIEDHQGRLLVSNNFALFEFIAPADPKSRGRWKKWPLTLAPNQAVGSLVAEASGTLWIGTNQGLIKYQDGRQTLYTMAQGLSDNNIHCLSQDRDGNLWIGGWRDGACKLSGEMIVSFTKAEGLPHQPVYKVIEDRQGRIYASTDAGVAQILAGRAVLIQRSQSPPFNNIHGRILQDSRGNWWMGTDQGLFRFQEPELQLRRGQKFILSDEILEAGIASICEDSTGRVWVSSYDTNLYWCDPARKGRTMFERLPSGTVPRFGFPWMMSDRSGVLWFGWQGVLVRFMNGKAVMFQSTDGLPEPNPRAFFQDRRGWFWIGLRYKGVSMTKDPTAEHPTFVNYSTANGLASDSVWSITEDDFGRMYFGTGRGLDRLDLSTGRIRHFTTVDGLAGDAITHCMKDSRGNIWVATATGLSKLNPRAERLANRPPPIYLSRVQVAGEDLALAETGLVRVPERELPSSRNNLLIEYVGLDFQSERRLKYQYKLDGVDADWTASTDQRSVNYARLAPGSYRFLVRAINEEGLSSAEPAVFTFRILPPIWQRGWFLTLAALLAAGVVYLIYRYRVARLLELERVRTRIAADLHDDVGAGLSQMALLSEMAKSHIRSDPQRSAQILTDVAEAARALVDTMSDIVWSVDPRQDDLEKLIARVRQFASDVLEARAITWDFQTPPEPEKVKLTPEQRRHLFLIFKESINNIVRHAECTSVWLSISLGDHRLLAEIRDDGRGFVMPSSTEPVKLSRQGHGLKNMQTRAAELSGQCRIESGPGRGARVSLSVPLK
jgi:ligand-binding sensor domain-containing protein/signal transduction histidine kinase